MQASLVLWEGIRPHPAWKAWQLHGSSKLSQKMKFGRRQPTVPGSRFPAELQPVENWQTQGYSKRELPIETVEAYRGRFSKRACGLACGWMRSRRESLYWVQLRGRPNGYIPGTWNNTTWMDKEPISDADTGAARVGTYFFTQPYKWCMV